MEFGRSLLFLPLLLFVLGAGIALVTYGRLPGRLSNRERLLFVLFRVSALLLLILALMEPTRVSTREEPVRAQVLVLRDRSRSMSISDEAGADGTRTRWEAASETAQMFAERLRNRFDVREYVFDSALRPVHPEEVVAPEGRSTDVLRAVQTAIESARGTPIAGVLLFTDGIQNVGTFTTPERYEAPVFAIGVGNPKPPKDIAVLAATSEPVLFVDEKATIRATIRAQGYPNRALTVTLSQDDRLLTAQTVQTNADQTKYDIAFDFTPKQEGTFRYTIAISPLLDEFSAKNNHRTLTAQVLPSRIRVLMIEGTPRHEFAFLRRTLRRMKSIELRTVFLATPNVPRAGDSLPAQRGVYPLDREKTSFPATAAAFFKHDVIVIGDVAVPLLTETQRRWLTEFVERRGKGIAWLAGESWLARPFGVRSLDRLLPVSLPPSGARVRDGEFAPTLTPEGRFHPITQLASSPEENDLLWRQMPLWTRLYSGLQPKPGATVLVTAGQGAEPLILYERVGAGKSLLIATDALWRWAFAAKLRYDEPLQRDAYDRFWAQTVRWLATPSDAKRVAITLGQPRLETGDVVEIAVRVYDTGFLPVSDASVDLTATDPKGNTSSIPITASQTTPGLYQARLLLAQPGTYRLSATATARGIALGNDALTFEAETPRLEFERIARNDALLSELASASGGRFVTLADADGVLSLLRESRETRTYRVRQPLWDSPFLLIGVVLLLGMEWFLRKRKGLI